MTDKPTRLLDHVAFRREWLKRIGSAATLMGLGSHSGCVSSITSNDSKNGTNSIKPDLIWGKLGLADGRFQKPRAMTIDRDDSIYIVDKTGRVQVFSTEGEFLRLWRTPAIEMGKPTGLGIDREGNILVADTHYFRILVYTNKGILIDDRTIGGSNGPEIGQFAFVTDAIEDSEGNIFTSEYGEFDRIQKYDSDGKFICRFGETGEGKLQFSRPQTLAFDRAGNLWVSDACNHRLQLLRCDQDKPEWIKSIGEPGSDKGQFRYPYGLWLTKDDLVCVAEFGNHRIQILERDGSSKLMFGTPGRDPGQFDQPWTLAQDSQGRFFVLDTGNNRVQRFAKVI